MLYQEQEGKMSECGEVLVDRGITLVNSNFWLLSGRYSINSGTPPPLLYSPHNQQSAHLRHVIGPSLGLGVGGPYV